jgi:hypothetical protein
MADKKISALTAASTPLAGTEVLPIVQGGSTVKVSVDDLTAGKLVNTGAIISGGTGKDRVVIEPQNAGSGALLISTNAAGNAYTPIAFDGAYTKFNVTGTEVARTNGNGLAPVAGKGIDFSANTHAAGMTSELLNDYEEGTFTPSFTSTGATITHAVRSGIYTKVGRLVTASVYLQVSSATGTLTNPLFISDLPYASVSTGEYGFSAAIGVHQFSGITPSMFMGLNTTNISVYVNGTVTPATPVALAAGYYLATITYMTS